MLVIQLEKQTIKRKQELYIADMPWFIRLFLNIHILAEVHGSCGSVSSEELGGKQQKK